MRTYPFVIAALVVAACAPRVPDSAAGIGFDGVESYQQQREIELAGGEPLVFSAEISGEQLPDVASAPSTLPVTTQATAPSTDNPDISDEQEFDAVAARETIQSDAARRAAQQQAYQVIEPTALPTRAGGSGATIVEFALSTTNLLGQTVYQRSSLFSSNKFLRNCAKYTSSDFAQQAFLQAGGPERDRRGVDPDGDGFACAWDPTPFRQAVRN